MPEPLPPNPEPASMTGLLASKRFLPLLITQFLGALNDNVYKAALLVYLSYRASAALGIDGSQMLALAAGLFVLPFLLFSAYAGQLADIKERAGMTRVIKFIEIVLMIIASVCFFLPVSMASLVTLMALIFLMGAQSTFFGPIKYSLIPSLLEAKEIAAANALVGSSTFVSILIGTILGTALAAAGLSHWLAAALVGLALCGWLASLAIPKALIADPGGRINTRPLRQIAEMVRQVRANRLVWRCVLGISWFWTVGAVYLTQLPQYCASHLGLDESAVTAFLATLLLGIGLGALLCPVLLRRVPATALALPALLAMALAIGAFSAISLAWAPPVCAPNCGYTLADLFGQPLMASALLASLLLTAIAGGVFVVPLYISVQLHADRRYLSSTIATNNIFNSLFMVLSSIVSMIAIALGSSVVGLFALTALFALGYVFLLPSRLPALSAKNGDDDEPREP